ncbi:hypothetical protein LCGC14_2569860, partial [marine sediment metagenome]
RRKKRKFKPQPFRSTITPERLKNYNSKTPGLTLVEGVDIELLGLETLDPATLNLDRGSYQRGEQAAEVLEIAAKLDAKNGYLPTIKVSERPDGSRWVVDGQQRCYAAEVVGRGVRAEIWRILSNMDPIEVERRWFAVENASVTISPIQNVIGHPGAARTVLVEWLRNDPKSALRNRIQESNSCRFPLLYVMKYLYISYTGILRMPRAQIFMSRFDKALEEDADRLLKFAMMGANLLVHVFEGPIAADRGNRLMGYSLQALGLATNRRWGHLPLRSGWPQPEYGRLRWIQEYPWGRMTLIEGDNWRGAFNNKVENILEVWPAK